MLRAAAGFGRALDAVMSAPGIVPALRAADALAHEAGMTTDPGSIASRLAGTIAQEVDQLAAIAAVHALSAVPGPGAPALLADLLGDRRWHVSEHASWALSARGPYGPAMPTLATMVSEGGFRGMLAQRTLGGWAMGDAPAVHRVVADALQIAGGAGARGRLSDTLGLIPGSAV
ncbi:MAG: glycosyltransferase, partial [Actinomycetes bacterium]